MIKWAGWIITLCGIGHTAGSLIQTAPDNAGRWFDGSLWSAGGEDFGAWSEPVATFWYTLYSFGPPLLLIGVTVLWMDRRGITPPSFIAWAITAWVVITFVASGWSPLPLLLIAAGLLVVGNRNVIRSGRYEARTE